MFSNQGWGLRKMAFNSAIILIALLFVIYHVYLFINKSNEKKSKIFVNYSSIETHLENAALRYVKEYYSELDGTITVTTSNLVRNGYLSFYDLSYAKDECDGYALVKKNDDSFVIRPYIQCQKYETEHYQNWRVGV